MGTQESNDEATSIGRGRPEIETLSSSAPPVELRGFIDGFEHPARIMGWATKRSGGLLLNDLFVEARRDGQVVAQTAVTIPRRDVTLNDQTPAGFALDLTGITTAEDLLLKRVSFFLIDTAGRCIDLRFTEVTLAKIERNIAEVQKPYTAQPDPDGAPHFEYLKAEIGRLGVQRALIITSIFRGLHGSPLVAFDVGQVLAKAGVDVEYFALDVGPPFVEFFAGQRSAWYSPARNANEMSGASYDLVWAQHWPAYGFAFFELNITTKYLLLACLSSFEVLESLFILTRKADMLVFNAPSTESQIMSSLETQIPVITGVTYNALPPDWFTAPTSDGASERPRQIAVVSNRGSEEVRDAARLLTADGIDVQFFGSSDHSILFDQALVDKFDVIITIGHTVQKALARARPVYCYDRFGGPGYIDFSNIESAEIYNFSGRDRPVKKSPIQIRDEILQRYVTVRSSSRSLRASIRERYRLDLVLAKFFAQCTTKGCSWRDHLDPHSTERKLVRSAVNNAVGYDLFTPESAIYSRSSPHFVSLTKSAQHSDDIAFFSELNNLSANLYAVSPVARYVMISGFILPTVGLKIESVIATHDGGAPSSANINLPSPWLRDKFPDHPDSHFGRFRIQITITDQLKNVTLIAIFHDGRSEPFFKIDFKPF